MYAPRVTAGKLPVPEGDVSVYSPSAHPPSRPPNAAAQRFHPSPGDRAAPRGTSRPRTKARSRPVPVATATTRRVLRRPAGIRKHRRRKKSSTACAPRAFRVPTSPALAKTGGRRRRRWTTHVRPTRAGAFPILLASRPEAVDRSAKRLSFKEVSAPRPMVTDPRSRRRRAPTWCRSRASDAPSVGAGRQHAFICSRCRRGCRQARNAPAQNPSGTGFDATVAAPIATPAPAPSPLAARARNSGTPLNRRRRFAPRRPRNRRRSCGSRSPPPIGSREPHSWQNAPRPAPVQKKSNVPLLVAIAIALTVVLVVVAIVANQLAH